MKNTLILTFAVVLIAAASAFAAMPVDKGNMFIAGGLSFTKYSGDLYKDSEDNTPTLFSFYPEFYYFVRNGIAIGGALEYSRYSLGDNKSTDIGFGVGGKYYFIMKPDMTEAKGLIYPYAGAKFMYISSKDETALTEYKLSGYDFIISGGGVYMLSNSVGAFGELGFTLSSLKPENGDSQSGNSFGLTFGVTYFIIK